MKACVLASGSSGNSTYIETKNKKILIDLGMSVKYINEKLREIGTNLDEIDLILITHLHSDHISTLKTLDNYKIEIYVTNKMYKSLKNNNNLLNYVFYDDEINFEGLEIKKIVTSHDSIDSRGFIITEENNSVVYITDTGYLSLKTIEELKNKELYIMESNHDPIMLREGKYPLWLQRRILSDKGHLSNELSAIYLSKLIGPNTKKVFLAHLSKENNCETIALKTFTDKLKESEISFKEVSCAKPSDRTEVVTL